MLRLTQAILSTESTSLSLIFNTHLLSRQLYILTKHKAVVAQNDNSATPTNTGGIKHHKFVPFRKRSPGQHADLLKYLQTYSWEFILDEQDTQIAFDSFYNCCSDFINTFYPEKYVKIKLTVPSYMTPQIKLLEKSKLMKTGEMFATASIAGRIGQLIAAHNSKSFESGGKHLDSVQYKRISGLECVKSLKRAVQSKVSQLLVPSSSICIMYVCM